ncbi:DUF2188 domain-containing protein [Arthrobacter sp. BE255]|uniref:DUF2188 domain-containing protein n=1 Tax=Arthrobacter sp. BE255 TaxID=2817721 RepID=UPI0037C027F6
MIHLAGPNSYQVVPGDDGWKGEREGSPLASSVHDTQAAAIDAARGYPSRPGGGESKSIARTTGSGLLTPLTLATIPGTLRVRVLRNEDDLAGSHHPGGERRGLLSPILNHPR